jgi:hypothetical protein
MYDNNKGGSLRTRPLVVVVRGFEPRQTEPKPVVLPLHHTTIIKSAAKLSFLYKTTKKKRAFLIVFA